MSIPHLDWHPLELEDSYDHTGVRIEYTEVPGGRLYRALVFTGGSDPTGVSLAFVPDPKPSSS